MKKVPFDGMERTRGEASSYSKRRKNLLRTKGLLIFAGRKGSGARVEKLPGRGLGKKQDLLPLKQGGKREKRSD